MLGIIKILEFKPWNLYKLKTVNYVDSFLISLIITLFLYASIIFIVNKNVNIKVIISSILVFVLYILEVNRIVKINKTKDKKQQTNVYDLKDLYEGKIKNENSLILIREKEVEYDLLERGHIINKLYELVSSCCNEEKFVVALDGEVEKLQ